MSGKTHTKGISHWEHDPDTGERTPVPSLTFEPLENGDWRVTFRRIVNGREVVSSRVKSRFGGRDEEANSGG